MDVCFLSKNFELIESLLIFFTKCGVLYHPLLAIIAVTSTNEVNYYLYKGDEVLFESLNNKNFSKDVLGPS